MNLNKIVFLAVCLAIPLLFGACDPRNRYETETTVAAPTGSRTRVVKDEIPAEGQRKIPVVEQY